MAAVKKKRKSRKKPPMKVIEVDIDNKVVRLMKLYHHPNYLSAYGVTPGVNVFWTNRNNTTRTHLVKEKTPWKEGSARSVCGQATEVVNRHLVTSGYGIEVDCPRCRLIASGLWPGRGGLGSKKKGKRRSKQATLDRAARAARGY